MARPMEADDGALPAARRAAMDAVTRKEEIETELDVAWTSLRQVVLQQSQAVGREQCAVLRDMSESDCTFQGRGGKELRFKCNRVIDGRKERKDRETRRS